MFKIRVIHSIRVPFSLFLIREIRVIHSIHSIRVLFCTLLILSSSITVAQVFPVQITTNIRGPYSLNLSDYATPAYDRIQTNLYMADLTKINYPVKIRLVLRGPGGISISTSPGFESGPFLLDGGTTLTLTGAELYTLFDASHLNFSGITYNQYKANQALPEGIYQFHFEAIDFNNNVGVSNLNLGFANAWLILNDPPVLNRPFNDATITPLNPQNFTIQWTPRHTGSPNSALTTVYDLQLVEIYPSDRNPNDAMLSTPPVFETTTNLTSYNYSIIDPALVENRWYAFRVRARDENGLDLFKNQGYSEVYRFYYGKPCPQAGNFNITVLDASSSILSFNSSEEHQSFEADYKMSWQKWYDALHATSSENRLVLRNLQPGERYDIRLRSYCTNNFSEYDTLSFTNIGNRLSCVPPALINARRKNASDPTSDVILEWPEIAGVNKYTISIRTPEASGSWTVRSESISVDELTKTDGTKIPVPDKFEAAIGTECKDGGSESGEFHWFDLSNGSFTFSECIPSIAAGLEENLMATFRPDKTTLISWNAQIWAKSYTLSYRRFNNNDAWQTIEASSNSAVVSSLIPGKIYEYKITYHCPEGQSVDGVSNTFILEGEIIDPGTATGECFFPSGVLCEIDGTSATLRWDKEPGTIAYVVQYRIKGSDDDWQTADTRKETVTLKGLVKSTEYECKIHSSCESGGRSIAGPLVFFTTSVDIPVNDCEKPYDVKDKSISSSEIMLDWDYSAGQNRFVVQYRKKGSSTWMEAETQNGRYVMEYLEANTIYEYQVASYCSRQKSDFTATDTAKTRTKESAYQCNASSNIPPINSIIPTTLETGDQFTAADFPATVRKLESGNPYNGEITVPVPFLNNDSKFIFQMVNAQVSESGQLYSGYAYMKTINLRIIDEETANKIDGFVDELDNILKNGGSYVNLIDSLGTIIGQTAAVASEPIDWNKYAGWTYEQLLEEGNRLVEEGNKLVQTNDPSKVPEGVSLIKEGLAVLARAAEMLKDIKFNLKDIFRKELSGTRDSLIIERDKKNRSITLYDKIDQYNGYSLNQPATSVVSDPNLTYETEAEEIQITDLESEPTMSDIVSTYKKERNDIATKLYLENLVSSIETILADELFLEYIIEKAKNEITTIDIRNIEPEDITVDRLEKEIKRYVQDFIIPW